MKKAFYFSSFFLCLIFLWGCPEENEVINHLQLSDQFSSGIAGGWFRTPIAIGNEDSGRATWDNDSVLYSTTIYVVEGIVARCPDNPNFLYVLFSPQGKEDNAEVGEQILKDLQFAKKDLSNDGKVDQEDLVIVLEAGERDLGNVQPAPELMEMVKNLPKTISVEALGKKLFTWGRVKNEAGR